MKKKLFSILSVIFMFVVCLTSTACGDKYKDMEFKVYYAFTQDAGEWYDASNGISIHYDEENQDSLIFDEVTQTAKLYIKVEIKNVKPKHIGRLTISSTQPDLEFTSTNVSQNEVFALTVNNTGIINTSLNIFENKSRKQTSLSLNISKTIKGIEVRGQEMFAIQKPDLKLLPSGDVDKSAQSLENAKKAVNLNALNNLKFLPYNESAQQSETDQTEVNYFIEAIGHYDAVGGFVLNRSAADMYLGIERQVEISNDLLVIYPGYVLNDESYIVQIKAVSAVDSEIFTVFDVYIVESTIKDEKDEKKINPSLEYSTGNAITMDTITIYNGSVDYNKEELKALWKIDENAVVYDSPKNTSDIATTIFYELNVYLDGEKYDFSQQQNAKKGLMLSKEGNEISINLAHSNYEDSKLKISYELNNLTFSNGTVVEYSKEITIKKDSLPSNILFGELALNGQEKPTGTADITAEIYHVDNKNYKGFEIKLDVSPSKDHDEIIQIEKTNSIKIYDIRRNELDDDKETGKYYETTAGSTIYVKFASESAKSAKSETLTFRTLKTPKKFGGADIGAGYIEVEYEFKKVVTANTLEFYKDSNCSPDNKIKDKQEVLIDANGTTQIYLKAYYTPGTTLSSSSITITSGNDEVLFGNDDESISANLLEVTHNSNDGYSIFTLNIKANKALQTSKISAVAGEGLTSTKFTAKSIKLLDNPDKLNLIVSDNSKSLVKDYTKEDGYRDGRYYFAVPTNKILNFEVVERDGPSTYTETVTNLTYSIVEEINANFSNEASYIYKNIIPNNMLELKTTTGGKTQIIQVLAEYYYKDAADNNIIKSANKEFLVEVAVYQPITHITLSATNKNLIYLENKLGLSEHSRTNITYNAGASGEITKTIHFTQERSVEDVAGLRLESVTVDVVEVPKGNIRVKNAEKDIYDGGAFDKFKFKDLTGIFTLEKTSSWNFNSVRLVVNALSFGEQTNISEPIEIKAYRIDPILNIKPTGEKLNIDGDIPTVTMSFIDIKEDSYAETEFGTILEYGEDKENSIRIRDLDYILYRYELTSDGLIKKDANGSSIYKEIDKTELIITNDNGYFTIKELKNDGGGIYRLEIVAVDSSYHNEDIEKWDYKTKKVVNVKIEDGVTTPFTLNKDTDLYKINNNLTAKYVLGNNITITADDWTPIGTKGNTVSEFVGTLSGAYSPDGLQASSVNYQITFTINNNVYNLKDSTTFGKLGGLFTIIGEQGKVENLTLKTEFNLYELKNANKKGFKLGALAGVNKGTISNVNLVLTGKIDIKSTVSDSLDIGGMVGQNDGIINLSEITSVSNLKDNALKISSDCQKTHNIGLIAGINNKDIIGTYENLETIKFDVLANLEIENIVEDGYYVENPKYNIGVVAGLNGENSKIDKVLVGGAVKFKNGTEAGKTYKSANGYLAGIVGSAGTSTVSNCVAIGLNLTATDLSVAGIAGKTTSTVVNNVKFISALLINNSTVGTIKSDSVAAGIVADADSNTKIYIASVESFINKYNGQEFYTIEGKETYGLAKGDDALVIGSFVKANIKCNAANSIYLTSNSTNERFTYFVGKVSGSAGYTQKSTYVTIYTESTIVENTAGDVALASVESISGVTIGWSNSKKINFVKVESDENPIYLPYLTANGDYFMVVAPESLDASLVQTGNVYIDFSEGMDLEIGTLNFSETVIVNYYDKGGDADNTHNLVDTVNKLIELSVLPEEAKNSSGIQFRIVGSGYRFAQINSDNTIKFIGISGNTPIIVEISSVFNNEIKEYVAFYTQAGLTGINLTSNNIQETNAESFKYSTAVYSGMNEYFITLSGENIKDGKEFFDMLSVHGVDKYLKLVATSDKADSLLNISTKSDFKSNHSLYDIMLSLRDRVVGPFADGYYEDITFTLEFDVSYFDSEVKVDSEKELASTTMRVYFYNSANRVEITSGDFDISTNGNVVVSASLETGFVNANTGVSSLDGEYINGEYILTASGHDSIKFSLKNTSGKDVLSEVMRRNAKLDYPVELFNFYVLETPIEENSKVIRYDYRILISLKDDFNIRHISGDIGFEFIISAQSDPNVKASVNVKVKPTNISTIRLENYAVNSINVSGEFKNLIERNTVESSIIAPGGKGSIMLLYVEPAFANIKTIKIKTTSLFVPSLGRDVQLKFVQFVRRDGATIDTGKYETLYSGNDYSQVGDTLQLQKITGYDKDGNPYYTGIIYIHAQLEKFRGLEERISATVTIDTDAGEKSVTKHLVTSYVSGAELNYNGQSNGKDKEYLVQTGTAGNKVDIKVYGYQFNSNPTVSAVWELNSGSKYFYVDTTSIEISNQTEFEKALLDNKVSSLWYIKENKENKEKNAYETNVYLEGIDTYFKVNSKSEIYDIQSRAKFLIGNYVNTRLNKDYQDVEYNPADASYTMSLTFNILDNIPAAFSIGATLSLVTEDGEIFTPEASKLVFHPTDYILQDVEIKTANGEKKIAVNDSDVLEFIFSTDNKNKDDSEALYETLYGAYPLDKNENPNLLDLLSYGSTDLSEEISYFDVNFVNNKISITGNEMFNGRINLAVRYGYDFDEETGRYNLKFGSGFDIDKSKISSHFTLNIVALSQEEGLPTPIYSAEEMFNVDGSSQLQDGAHYILMEDIDIDFAISPITAKIGSLDGNNKIISISSFKVDEQVSEYGLFGNLSTYTDEMDRTHQSILKNVIVDYSKFESVGFAGVKDIVFGGLVGNNSALIYNCDVMNVSARTRSIEILMDNDENSTITFGGLVGENNGVITNSRVGRLSYTKITATAKTESTRTVTGGNLAFNIVANGDRESNKFNVVAGGFVGVNSGTIASSYFANTSLINNSTSTTLNKTAGFVAENSGDIAYSYVKARESTITRANPYSTGARIENTGNGIIAGFVYQNNGHIENSFANTELKTNSAYMAGFVYQNLGAKANIESSYAACTMNSKISSNEKDKAEQPFVGLNKKGEILSTGTLKNVYYLYDGTSTSASSLAQGLNVTNFQESRNLTGFVFINSRIALEREQGIWSYYDKNNEVRILPEITNANVIAHSYKFLREVEKGEQYDKYYYTNAVSYSAGSKNNPHIIRNADEFNSVFVGANGETKSLVGYVRFINDIDFNDDTTAIKTRIGYTLGDEKNSFNITSVDGNGMTVAGIYFDVAEPGVEEIGLFANIKNSFVKNLNLEFATPTSDNQFSTTLVNYSGGLAGKIENSAIINIKLDGKSTTLTGLNFVGGLAGKISGNSLIYGIRSNLSVSTSQKNTNGQLYYSETDYNQLGRVENYESYVKSLSYAGGIAGVLDLTDRTGADYNLSFIDVHGDEMSSKVKNGIKEANILADYAGGIAGYASQSTSSLKLKYFVGDEDLIYGRKVAGGLFGLYLGSIIASQVTAEETTQFNYDTVLGTYIRELETKDSSINTEFAGNLNLVQSDNYAGGLIGVGVGSDITACYSKAGIKNGTVIGGLVGASVASTITYSYAVPYVNLSNIQPGAKIGGLIGISYGTRGTTPDRNREIDEYDAIAIKNVGTEENTDIQFTFSTVLVDNDKIEIAYNDNDNSVIIDYLCADSKELSDQFLLSGGSPDMSYIFVAEANYKKIAIDESKYYSVKNINADRIASAAKLSTMYDLDNVAQESLFTEIFSSWTMIKYWSCDHTKYFPLLLSDKASNYIIINDVNDFAYIEANPSGDFKITNNIEFSGVKDGNWIFNCNFTGTLVGETENANERPEVSGLALKTKESNSSGLFRQTTNAKIFNIEFRWDALKTDPRNTAIDIQADDSITSVGGLSCQDSGSEFTNIKVSVSGNDNNYLVKSVNPITSFGGLVAEATNTNINTCSFEGSASVNLNKGGEDVYFGGLVGKADRNDSLEVEEEDGSLTRVSMTISGSTVGLRTSENNRSNSKFNVTVGSADDAYIALGVGDMNYCSISGLEISNGSIGGGETPRAVDLNIDFDKSSNGFVGGFIGSSTDSVISNSDILSSMLITGEVASGLNVGGIAGGVNINSDSIEYEIDKVNSMSDIKLYNAEDPEYTLNSSNLSISGGVAKAQGDTIGINQCLVKGSISQEEKGDVSTVYAGGMVAYSTGKTAINNVVTDVNMLLGALGSNKTTSNMTIGGIAGNVADVEIHNSITMGRLIPIVKANNNSDKLVAGGIIGSVLEEKTAELDHIIALSSIITDGLIGQAVDNSLETTDAVVGNSVDATINVAEVYYSSDYALATSEHGVNLSGYTLAHTNNWHAPFMRDNAYWKQIATSSENGNVPVLINMQDAMIKYGLFNEFGKYIPGSALRPYVDETIKDVSEGFKYYILSTSENAPYSVSGALNGLLMGFENIYSADSVAGLIINKHSAVSNVHLNIADNSTISLNGVGGFIASTNNGMIFNCSVQGKEIILTKAAEAVAEENYLGVVAGTNNGHITYSYSSIEIVDTMFGSSKNKVGGITYMNNGIISTCYFTGYINNFNRDEGATGTRTDAAGIFLVEDVAADDEVKASWRVFNNYMAGTIAKLNVKENEIGNNAFTSISSEDLNSKTYLNNNFVDSYANFNDGLTYNSGGVRTASTAQLMTNLNEEDALLKGDWYTSGFNNGEDGVTLVQLETDGAGNVTNTIFSDTFGLNYCYPILKVNKYALNASLNSDQTVEDEGSVKDLDYQLYTGTGEDNTNLNKADYDPNINEYWNDRGAQVINNADVYNMAFKVPHLGVLSAIQGLVSQGLDLNYVLIYDINGESRAWASIGKESKINDFKKCSSGFKGVFISDKNLNKSSDKCAVDGLNREGLFTNIHDAYIGHLVMGSFTALKESGTLGKTVIGTTVVNDIVYEIPVNGQPNTRYFSKISIDDTSFGGELFGLISKESDTAQANLYIQNIDTSISVISNGQTAGLIAGKMTAGQISFVGDNQLYANFASCEKAGGLIGEMSAGSIIGNASNKTTITVATYVEDVQHPVTHEFLEIEHNVLGGIVGVGEYVDVSESNISNILVNFSAPLESSVVAMAQSDADIYADIFGGLIGLSSININFDSCHITSNNQGDKKLKVYSKLANDDKKYAFGLLAGQLKDVSGTMTVSEFSQEIKNITLSQQDGYALGNEDSFNQGAGILIGIQKGNFDLVSYNNAAGNLSLSLDAQTYVNVGGMTGLYLQGNAYVAKDIYTEKAITIAGRVNVGGVLGYSETTASENFQKMITVIDPVTGQEVPEPDSNYANFFSSDPCVSIEIKYSSSDYASNPFEFKNIGGLVGYLKGDIENATNQNSVTILNKVLDVEDRNVFVKNVGGIAGKFTGLSASNLSNTAEISTYSEFDVLTKGYIGNDYDGRVNQEVLNVGGLFGIVAPSGDAAIYKVENTGKVTGYQSVGGFIGYMSSGVLLHGSEKPEGEDPVVDPTITYDNVTGAYSGFGGTANSGEIIGAINVGGIVGTAVKTEIVNVASRGKITGNANVGGIVGYAVGISDAEVQTIKASIVESASSANAFINAVYYNYAYINSEGYFAYAAQLPTSVGGLIGNAAAYIDLTNNLVKNVKISSSKEGYLPDGESTQEGVISTYQNAMLTDTGIFNNAENIAKYKKRNHDIVGPSNNDVKFADVNTGIGGFAGTINASSMGDNFKDNNFLINGNISAQIGINVGLTYGSYQNQSDEPVKYPNIYNTGSETSNVSGGYNIGGIVGYIYEGQTVDGLSNEDLTGKSKIIVQNEHVGMFVGGLVGRVDSPGTSDGWEIDNTKDVKITINTQSSYYMGGLVGKYVGLANTGGDVEFDGTIGTQSITTSSITGDKNSAKEFGGLIGMLKIQSTNGGVNVKVTGVHHYPFTINTIENSNYYDGRSEYEFVESEDDINLFASAQYVNLDKFNIQGTSNTDWYSASAKNPLKEVSESAGWAKEYTGFRAMQRCIPESENNGALWDSVANVYDAEKIIAVGTIGNLRALNQTNSSLGVPDGEFKKKNEHNWHKVADNPDYICYTVYGNDPKDAILYSAVGIATPYLNEEGEFEYPYSRTGDTLSWVVGAFMGSTPSSLYYIDMNTWYGGNNNPHGETVNGFDATTVTLSYFKWEAEYRVTKVKRGFVWAENGYDYIDEDREYLCIYPGTNSSVYVAYTADIYPGGENAYFVFDTIYENTSTKSRVSGAWGDETLPKSGCIFDVMGIQNLATQQKLEEEPFDYFGVFAKTALTIAEIAITIYTCGAFTAATASAKGALAALRITARTTWNKVVSMSLKKRLLVFAVITSATMYAMNTLHQYNTASSIAGQLYVEQKGRVFGLRSSDYTKPLKYRDGKIYFDQSDRVFELDGLTYILYSNSRPSDYYQSLYVGISDNAAGETIKLFSMKDIDEVAPNLEIGSTVTINGKNYKIYYNYLYKNGSYYSCADAMEVGYSRVNALSLIDTSGVEEWKYYVNNYDLYVYGDYDGDKYEIRADFEGNPNHIIKNGANSYKNIYGGTFDRNAVVYKLPVKFEHFSNNATDVEGEESYGYEYMSRAYYTAKGRLDSSSMTAKFVLDEGLDTGRLTYGVDYFTVYLKTADAIFDAEGNLIIPAQYEPRHYKFAGIDNSQTGVPLADYSRAEVENGDPLYISIYPASFTNPYNTSKISNTESTRDNYAYKKTTNAGILHYVEYFMFEGGYITKPDAGGQYSGDTEYVYFNQDLTYEYEYNGTTHSGEDIKITISNRDNTSIKTYTATELKNALGTNPSQFSGYYYDDCEVLDYFYVKDGNLYARRVEYVLKEGLLNNAFLILKDTESQEFYNFGQYAQYANRNFYTRYKYSEFLTDATWDMSDKGGNAANYNIFATNGSPNYKPTYIVESANMIFGSGSAMKLKDGTNVNSGGINIS